MGFDQQATILQTWLAMGSRIDTIWSMFIGIHLPLLGFILVVKTPLRLIEKAALLVGYVLFSWINWRALNVEYVLLAALTEDYASMLRQISSQRSLGAFESVIVNQIAFSDRSLVNTAIHLIAGVASALAILLNHSASRKSAI